MRYGSVGAVIAADSKANAVPLLRVGSITIVQRIILTLQQAGVFPIVVVTEKDEVEVTHQVAQLGVVFIRNEQPSGQMFEAVKLGLEFLQGKCDKVVFTPVNAPMFSAYTLQRLLASEGQIVKPTYNGRGGHPIVLKSEVLDKILSYEGSEGLRGALRACNVNMVAVSDPGILMNVHNDAELQEHLAEHNATLLSPTVKLSINKETVFFNSRLKLLLFLIEDLHSARQACFHAGLAYQNAWNMINKLEEETGYAVVTRQRGGKNGGETCLTEKGKQLMYAFQQYEEEVNAFAQQRFDGLFRKSKLI